MAEAPGASLTLADFTEFAGVRRGDTIDRVVTMLGAAEEDESSHGGASGPGYRYHYYEESALAFGYERDTLRIGPVRVEVGGLARLAAVGVRDPRLALVGKPVDTIVALLGTPNEISFGNYKYELDVDGQTIALVNFVCYDFWGKECRELHVQWLYHK